MIRMVLPLESYVAADCNAASGCQLMAYNLNGTPNQIVSWDIWSVSQPMTYDLNGTPNQIVCWKLQSDGYSKSRGGVRLL